MGEVRQRLLKPLLYLFPLALAFPGAQKFYPDDPVWREPKPLNTTNVLKHGINEYYDFFQETFFEPDKDVKKHGTPTPSAGVNTLGEVPDSTWFTNRRLLTAEQFALGPGESHAPATDHPWEVVSGKNEGITPGLVIKDSAGRRYFLKFDPKSNPEMASSADVLGSKFFYDLGYNVPENYIVYFSRGQLAIGAKSKYRTPDGSERPMRKTDIEDVLQKVPRDREGRYRGMASLSIPGDIIGPFRYYGTRKDDPNDFVLHQRRRDLRGLYVFAAWLNHTDTKSINSLDALVEEGGIHYVRHYLIDFGAILGSDSFEAKSPRAGNVYLYDFKPAAWQFLSLGLYSPGWMRADYPHIPEIGHLEYETFNPVEWRNNYPNPAFDQRTPGDTYWAAKKVMAFSNEILRAIVAKGQYSDPHAAEWTVKCLTARRDKIGRAFFNKVLPLDDFAVRNSKLEFQDLAVHYGFSAQQNYTVAWSEFDNATGARKPIAGATSFSVPASAAPYVAAEIRGTDARKSVIVYLRGESVVGIDRTW